MNSVRRACEGLPVPEKLLQQADEAGNDIEVSKKMGRECKSVYAFEREEREGDSFAIQP
jgi:hypothetical protein